MLTRSPVGTQRSSCLPADNETGVGIDDERHIDPLGERLDVGVTGDLIVGDYGTQNDGVYEYRKLRDSGAFVEKLADAFSELVYL